MGLPNEATLIVHLLQDTDKESCDKTERENDGNDENAAHKKGRQLKMQVSKIMYCVVIN